MQPQSNEHDHPELERMIAERYRLLHEVMVTGFADLMREVRDGFGRVYVRLDQVDQRLTMIEAELRRIKPNGQHP
jgi:hypothetical protein